MRDETAINVLNLYSKKNSELRALTSNYCACPFTTANVMRTKERAPSKLACLQ